MFKIKIKRFGLIEVTEENEEGEGWLALRRATSDERQNSGFTVVSVVVLKRTTLKWPLKDWRLTKLLSSANATSTKDVKMADLEIEFRSRQNKTKQNRRHCFQSLFKSKFWHLNHTNPVLNQGKWSLKYLNSLGCAPMWSISPIFTFLSILKSDVRLRDLSLLRSRNLRQSQVIFGWPIMNCKIRLEDMFCI